MGRKGRVISAAVLRMNDKRNIEYPCLQLRILPVASQNPKNIFCRRKFRIRITDHKALVVMVMLVSMVRIDRDQRHRRNQGKCLTQNIWNGNIVCIVIIGI